MSCLGLITPSLSALFIVFAVSLLACSASPAHEDLGALKLGLTTQAGGITYRLSNARFMLEGPESRELSADDQDELSLELPAGAYRLTLQEGFQLAPAAGGAAVGARLISQNPTPVLVSAGETARATLRFELTGGTSVALGAGKLQVDIAVGAADAGSEASTCALGLRINEVDYEQANSDETEFIELLNTSSCTASLEGVTLELVNGGDGKVYSRYALADAAPSLAAGERLVLGDASVLAALPTSVKRAMLNGSGLQNGPDGLRLVRAGQTLDRFAYEGEVADAGAGQAAVADDGEQSLSRCPDGFDTEDDATDFRLGTPTPGTASVCS
jgi:hypothetical protein